jgi:response regulator RpfG family c-di-GMP phosphodiesterase
LSQVKEKPSIVVVDASQEYLSLFASDDAKDLIRFLTAHDRAAAQLVIADKKNFIAGIIVSSNSCDPFGVPLIRFAKQHRPATPVYLVLEEKETEPEKEMVSRLHIAGLLRKPLDRQDITSKVFPYSYFEMEKALEVAKGDTTAANAEVAADDQEMHAILAKEFLCGSKSFFDVYVRLNSGRYIKLLKAGDEFNAARVKEYLQKGVQYFYIKKAAQEVYLQYCDSMTGVLLHKNAAPVDIKVAQVMNYGKETTDFLKARGYNESTILTAKQFVTHSSNLVKQLKPEKNPVLKKFLSNVVLCEHGTGITMMTGMMLDALNFKDEKVITTLALAGFMHDIGLVNMPPKFADENEKILSEEEWKLFITHPIVGYEMARNIRMISPIVPATILEHHERRTGQGFPYCRGAGMISTVSEVIGIVDVFINTLKESAKVPGFDIAEHMQKVVYNQFSFQVMEAFDKTFLKELVKQPP